jgi:hypothetical protein
VPITPFGLKDWERWDDGAEESPARLEGFVSRGGELAPHRFDPRAGARRSPTRSMRSRRARRPRDGVRAALAAARDALRHDRGARAMSARARSGASWTGTSRRSCSRDTSTNRRAFSSSYRDAVGRTVAVNPGQFGNSRLCGVWFDPVQVEETLRHTVYG